MRQGRSYVSGHEPIHASKSATCIVLDPATGYWFCRSCGQGGDALTLVMRQHDLTYAAAAAFLTARYGAPTAKPSNSGRRSQPRTRKQIRTEAH